MRVLHILLFESTLFESSSHAVQNSKWPGSSNPISCYSLPLLSSSHICLRPSPCRLQTCFHFLIGSFYTADPKLSVDATTSEGFLTTFHKDSLLSNLPTHVLSTSIRVSGIFSSWNLSNLSKFSFWYVCLVYH